MNKKDQQTRLDREAQALKSLNSSIEILLKEAITKKHLQEIIDNEYFTPAENEMISFWFARFLTIRSGLWQLIDDSLSQTQSIRQVAKSNIWPYFVLGYFAVCLLIRIDRFLINRVATHSIIQRKLNESFPEHQIIRKQYTHIVSQLVSPHNAIRIHQAHKLLIKHSSSIHESVKGSRLEKFFLDLPNQEKHIDLSKRNYCIAWLQTRRHSWRRRGASAKQKSLFTILEYGGRAVSELMLPREKNVSSEVIEQLDKILQPGDIFITRHKRALTNVFLPGFWPHAALYVGSKEEYKKLHRRLDLNLCDAWSPQDQTFEALKDGIHFRPLEETLSVDAFVVLRPNLSKESIAAAISRVSIHAGKGYNFDFDFFRSDQLVCTEVIYRAYDGIDDFNIPLHEIMGRKSLSAEHLLDLSLDTHWAEPIAIFGVGKNKKELQTGGLVKATLINSYR